jgi:hypothetical protein
VDALAGDYWQEHLMGSMHSSKPLIVPNLDDAGRCCQGRTVMETAAKWKDILFTTGAKPGDYLTGV